MPLRYLQTDHGTVSHTQVDIPMSVRDCLRFRLSTLLLAMSALSVVMWLNTQIRITIVRDGVWMASDKPFHVGTDFSRTKGPWTSFYEHKGWPFAHYRSPGFVSKSWQVRALMAQNKSDLQERMVFCAPKLFANFVIGTVFTVIVVFFTSRVIGHLKTSRRQHPQNEIDNCYAQAECT
jgi:hypothetical protein